MQPRYRLQHLDLELTRMCTWKCVHCSAEASLKTTDELTYSEIISILDQGSDLGVDNVGLTGGEPFLVLERLNKVLAYCKQCLNVKTHSHTNGYWSLSYVKSREKQRLIDVIIDYCDRISVTLYSLDPKVHDEITGGFNTLEAVKLAIEIFKNLSANFEVYIVPMKVNYNEIPNMIEFLYHDLEVKRIRILVLAPTGRARYPDSWKRIALSIEDEDWLNNKFREILMSYSDLDLSGGFSTKIVFPSLGTRHGHEFCHSAKTKCHIDSKGNVYPCTAASGRPEMRAGNVKQHDLADIWERSSVMNLIRKFHESPPIECRNCELYNRCAGGCRVRALFYHGSFTTKCIEDCIRIRNRART